jgi:arabinose-5-phosphate isomerase
MSDKEDFKNGVSIILKAKRVLQVEAEAVRTLCDRIDNNFTRAVEVIDQCKGKVIVIGIGKSGIIAQKIASTFACTGTPAFFLHPAEGIHGDIGMISKGDVVVAISHSGETQEIIQLLPLIKRWGVN